MWDIVGTTRDLRKEFPKVDPSTAHARPSSFPRFTDNSNTQEHQQPKTMAAEVGAAAACADRADALRRLQSKTSRLAPKL
jgi:hypothetical protein